MKIAIVTAGGAGMFCGSCMHDNTWARALTQAGHDVTLIPTYTPIRVDEDDVSARRVFLGGINIYLDSNSRVWRRIPRVLTRWLDAPWIIRFVSRFGVSNDAHDLGKLTIASLEGEQGPQRREVEELADFLCGQLQPDVICFSNALQVGAVHAIRRRFTGKLYCVLQGDDIFLADLPEPYRSQACGMISERAGDFDGFIVHSRYYGDFMAEFLSLPAERFSRIPLGLDVTGHDGLPGARNPDGFTIGYFARVCPEKGFHQAIEAFRLFHAEHPDAKFVAGGYLGARDRTFFDEQMAAAGDLGPAVRYLGSPARLEEKVELLKSLDVLSVPTVYREPKGLPVLEAWANGTPVVQPAHGSFPEMIEATGGGLLVPPNDASALAAAWERLRADRALRDELSQAGYRGVREQFSTDRMVAETLSLFGQ